MQRRFSCGLWFRDNRAKAQVCVLVNFSVRLHYADVKRRTRFCLRRSGREISPSDRDMSFGAQEPRRSFCRRLATEPASENERGNRKRQRTNRVFITLGTENA